MPYYTQLPDSFATVNAETGLIELGETGLLNQLGDAQQFDLYDVEATSATTLGFGDEVTLTDESEGQFNPLLNGTYAGSATLSTAAVGVNLGLTSLTIQLNPVAGHIVSGEDGQAYFVSDSDPSGNNLGLNVSGTLLGLPLLSQTIPLSDLAGVLGTGVAAAVNNTLNNLVVNVAYDPAGTLSLPDALVLPCFTAGTLILTPEGEVMVDSIRTGDLVITRDRGPRPVRWIGSTVVTAATLARNPKLRPIRIRAGALGAGTPSADLLVSPQHRILVRSNIAQRMFGTDEILVAAKQLLQLDGIDIAEDVREVEYFHILFDRHEVVISNGAETESLYTGPEAMKAVGEAAHEEIFALFPQLKRRDYAPEPARPLASGRMGRKLAVRHGQNRQPLVH